jgi:hypothetical protein
VRRGTHGSTPAPLQNRASRWGIDESVISS